MSTLGLIGRWVSLVVLAGAVAWAESAAGDQRSARVQDLRITVLSTNLAGDALRKGIGEWGYAALVEVDGRRLLFDTGNRPETVLHNARELGIDLSTIDEVVFSHHHSDHTGGLRTLRRAFAPARPAALSRVHVAQGAFVSRGINSRGGDENPLIQLRSELSSDGVTFVEHGAPAELMPGVWFTGPIPRPHPVVVPPTWKMYPASGEPVPDTTPEDAALIFDTTQGIVVLTGCAHAGLVNTILAARSMVGPDRPVLAIAGGFHLLRTPAPELQKLAGTLREFGVRFIHGGHCTSLEAVYRLRDFMGLSRQEVSVAAVGAWFDLKTGITPLILAE